MSSRLNLKNHCLVLRCAVAIANFVTKVVVEEYVPLISSKLNRVIFKNPHLRRTEFGIVADARATSNKSNSSSAQWTDAETSGCGARQVDKTGAVEVNICARGGGSEEGWNENERSLSRRS